MDIFLGLSAPQVPVDVPEEKTRGVLNRICRLLDEMMIKMRKFQGSTASITVVTDVRTDSGQLQKKTKVVTVRDGIIEAVGTESAWTNSGAV